jgi:hypothetical protein
MLSLILSIGLFEMKVCHTAGICFWRVAPEPAEAPERVLPIGNKFLLHREHPMTAQKAVHLGFRLADVFERDGEHLQLHRSLAASRQFSKT